MFCRLFFYRPIRGKLLFIFIFFARENISVCIVPVYFVAEGFKMRFIVRFLIRKNFVGMCHNQNCGKNNFIF